MIGSSRHLARAAAAIVGLASIAAVALAGCGRAGPKTDGVEGDYIKVGEALYQVQLSRLLNPGQRPDDNLLAGQPQPTPDQDYAGVFMIVQNKGDKPYTPPATMKLVDTQGNSYTPLDTAKSGFALDLEHPIPPGDQAPPPDSPASGGPDAAALVLFRISRQSATENLPLELVVPVPGGEPSHVGIDL